MMSGTHRDAVTQGAKTPDLVTAYNAAAGEGPTSPVAADLAGKTLLPRRLQLRLLTGAERGAYARPLGS